MYTPCTYQACEQLLREGLPSIATVLSREFEGREARRGGLPRHFDICLMSLGLLANCLELGDERVRLTVAAALVPPTVPGGTLLPLLANVLRALLRPVSATDEAAPADERRAMERQVSAAYVALVVGFLCRDAADLCAMALAELVSPPSSGPRRYCSPSSSYTRARSSSPQRARRRWPRSSSGCATKVVP